MHGLDKKDIAILKEMDFEARSSISAIAKRVKLSKEVTNYRLKRLKDDGVIQGFIAIIDSYMLGYQIYKIQLRLRNTSEIKINEMISYVCKSEDLSNAVILDGKWDLDISYWARNPLEFNKFYEDLMIKFGTNIHKKTIYIIIEKEHRPYNFIYEKQIDKCLSIGSSGRELIDSTDVKILDMLSKDCRMPLTEIAMKVTLTANAVKHRIKNLERSKIIKGYSTILNPNYFKLNHFRVNVFLADPSKKKIARDFLREQRDVVFINQVLGTFDIRFDILCESPMRIYKMIDELNHLNPSLVSDYDEILVRKGILMDYFPKISTKDS